MRYALWLVTPFAVLALAGPANAQLAYQFADAAGNPQTVFSVVEGNTLPIRIYLRDTTTGAPTLGANGGLGSSAVRLSYTNSSVASIAIPGGVAGAIPPWESGNSTGSVAGSSAALNVGIFTVQPNGALPQGDRIFLGTFTFTASSVGTSSLTAADPNPASNFDTTYYSNGDGLDTLISTASATLNVTPVPEPAALLLAAAGLGVRSVLRRVRAARRG